jgi:hypothetical protein
MTRGEREEVLKALTLLQEYHRIEPLSEALQLIYLRAFDAYPVADVLSALSRSVDVHRFFPKVPELKELIEASRDDQAELAWAELHSEFRRVGSWRHPTLSPLTEQAVIALCGNWERACALIGRAEAGPELQGWQNRFREMYQVLAERERLMLAEAPSRPQLVE